jgi:hypothetical protein
MNIKKYNNLIIGFGLITGAVLLSFIMVNGLNFRPVFGMASIVSGAVCPPIVAHPTVIYFNPEPAKVNQSVNIKTDTVYECGSASCVWYWTGSVNNTNFNTNGSFNTNFSSAGTKSVCVEVRADWGNGCGSVRVAYGCDTLVVNDVVIPTPTVDITANPFSVISGNSSTLSWTSTNATSCTASGAWSGSKSISGSQSTGSVYSSQTYNITCTGAGGSASDSVTVDVATILAPNVNIKANNSDGPITISSGSSATLSWTSNNTTSCTASGAWSGSKSISGSQSTGSLTSSKTYTITCTGAGGSASDSVTVNVGDVPPNTPTVNLLINGSNGPITIGYNTAATLSWTSNNTTSCTASGAWSGSKSISGSQSTGSVYSSQTYNITCTGAGGSASDSVTVSVQDNPPHCIPPGINTVNIFREPSPVCAGQSTLIKTDDLAECYGYYCEWRWSGDVGNISNMNTPNGAFNYTFSNGGTKNIYVGVWKRMAVSNCGGEQYYQIATGYLNFGVADYCTYTPTPTINPTPTPTPPICQHNLPALPLAQTSCVATPSDGGIGSISLSDGFSVRYNVPSGAVISDTNISVFVYRASDLSVLNVKVGNLSIIGNKIVQVIVENGNCQTVTLSKDAVINFTYPSSYTYGYIESSFTDYNTPNYANNWFMLPTARNASANTLTSLTSNLGYFAIYGPRTTYIPTPTPTSSPTPSPTPEVLGTTCIYPPSAPTDNDFLDSLFLAALIDRFKGIDFSLGQFLGILNLLLLILILWAAFYKKEKQEVKQETLAFNSSVQSNGGKSFGQWLAIPFVASAAYISKSWKERQERNKFWKEFKKNNTSLSSLLGEIKETGSGNISTSTNNIDLAAEAVKNNNQDDIKGSQFVIIK